MKRVDQSWALHIQKNGTKTDTSVFKKSFHPLPNGLLMAS
jgi:hypothetical protein